MTGLAERRTFSPAASNAAQRATERYREYIRFANEKKLSDAEMLKRVEGLERRSPLRTAEEIYARAGEGKKQRRALRLKLNRFPAASFLLTVAFACVLAFVVYTSVQLSGATRELNSLRSSVTAQSAEISDLQSSIEAKYNLDELEDYAMNDLGMIRKDKASSDYLVLGAKNDVVLHESEEESAAAPTLLSAFRDRIRALLEYFG